LGLSDRTKTVIASILIDESDDLYPHATIFADSPYTSQIRRVSDEVPTTTKDMSNMFKWEHGDIVRGTHAKEHSGMQEYRRDINTGYGAEDDYKDIYIDTFLEESIGDRLKDGDQ